jgi:hypothetical protein
MDRAMVYASPEGRRASASLEALRAAVSTPTGAVRMAAPQPSPSEAMRLGYQSAKKSTSTRLGGRTSCIATYPPDGFMADAALPQDSSRQRQGLFRIVRGFSDAPFIPLAGVTRDDVSRPAVESGYPSGIPPLNIGPGQHLRLLANGITGCQSFEAADYAFLVSHRVNEACPSFSCSKK